MGFFNNLFLKEKSKNTEDDFIVTITDNYVRVEHPNRKTEEICWNDIIEIRFINTNTGPFAPDIWLALIGSSSGCLIPQGAKGCDKIYDIVSKYDGFDFENVIKSMSSSDNEQFLLWTRK